MQCKKCGYDNEKVNKFCKRCGCKLEKEDVVDYKIRIIKAKKKRHILMLVSMVFIVVLLFICGVNIAYEWTVKVEREYLEADKYEKAVVCFNNAVSLNKRRYEAYSAMMKYYLDKDEPELDKVCAYYMKAPSSTQKKLERLGRKVKDINEGRNLISVYINEDNKVTYGLRDITGYPVLSDLYDDIREITVSKEGKEKFSGYYAVCLYSHWGIYDSEGEVVIEPVYDDIGSKLNADRIAVCSGGKWGFVDSKGKIAIEPQFDNAADFSESGVAIVNQDEKDGMIDAENQIILPFVYSYIFKEEKLEEDTGTGAYMLVKNDKYSLADSYGNIVTEMEYDDMCYTNRGLFKVETNKQFGYIDADGYEIIPADKKWVGFMGECGLVVVHEEDDTFAIYDDAGYYQYRINYYLVGGVIGDNGMFLVGKDSRIGFSNQYGDLVINYQYDNANKFSGGVCPVCIGEKWGLIDESGNEVVSLDYEHISNNGNKYLLQKNDKYKVYFAETGVISEKEYDDVFMWESLFDNGGDSKFLKVQMYSKNTENGENSDEAENTVKEGVINWYGEEIVPVEYDEIVGYRDRLICRDGDTYKMFDLEGKKVNMSEFPDYLEMQVSKYTCDLIPCSITGESYFMDLNGNRVMR